MGWIDPGIFYDNVEPLSAARLNILSDDAAYLLGRMQTNNPAMHVIREEWFRQYGLPVTPARYVFYIRHMTATLCYRVEGAWAQTASGWWHTHYGSGGPLPRWRLLMNGVKVVPAVEDWMIWPNNHNNRIKVWEGTADLGLVPISLLGKYAEVVFEHLEGDWSANPDGRPTDTYAEATYLYETE